MNYECIQSKFWCHTYLNFTLVICKRCAHGLVLATTDIRSPLLQTIK